MMTRMASREGMRSRGVRLQHGREDVVLFVRIVALFQAATTRPFAYGNDENDKYDGENADAQADEIACQRCW